MRIYEPHKLARKVPLMKGGDLEELKRSLLERGQDFPATIHEGKLLDGRNRQEALRQLVAEKKLPQSTELKVLPHRGEGSLAGFVRAANLDRRHLTPSQRAMVATDLLPALRAEAKERQRAAAKATNRKKKQPELLKKPKAAPRKAVDEAAKQHGVTGRTVQRAELVRKTDPKLAKQVLEGELTVTQAVKKLNHRAASAKVKVYVPPEGKYNVVTTDFSWEYDDTLDGSDAVRGGCPYPPMELEEILAFIRGPLAGACDEVCVLGVWVTGPIMLDLRIWPIVQRDIQALGFKPFVRRTWVKTEASGLDFTGLGRPVRWDTEELVLFKRGAVVFNELGAEHGRPVQRSSFRAPIGEHSEKPAKAYLDLEQLVPYTSRLEMFARAERAGWRTSGAELAESPRAVDDAVAPAGGKGEESLPALGASPSPTAEPEQSDDTSFRAPPATDVLEAPVASDRSEVSHRRSLTFECSGCKSEFDDVDAFKAHLAEGCAPAPAPAAITTDEEHALALAEVDRLMKLDPKNDTSEAQRLAQLAFVVEEYEKTRWPLAGGEGVGRTEDDPPTTPPVMSGEAGPAPEPLPPEFECLNCKATFVSREVLSKHSKACGEVVSLVEAIARGAAIIEVDADRKAVITEVHRLTLLKPQPASPDAVKLDALHNALDAYRKLKREGRAAREEPKPDDFAPPVDPASVAPVPHDDIPF